MTTKISNRTFGVELETIGLTEFEIIELFKKNKIPINTSYKNNKTHWRIDFDQSVENYEDYSAAAEVISPILQGSEGLRKVAKVCRMLQKAGAKVNETCGLHVHVGVKDLSVNEIYTILKRYRKHENVIDKFVHSSRRKDNSEFCRPIPNVSTIRPCLYKEYIEELGHCKEQVLYCSEQIENYKFKLLHEVDLFEKEEIKQEILYCEIDIKHYNKKIKKLEKRIKRVNKDKLHIMDLQNLLHNRYYKINIQSYDELGTLEFRHQNGTIDPKIVTNWIKFVLNFVEQGVKCTAPRKCEYYKYELLYKAFKRAPKRGLSKERIAKLLNVKEQSITRIIKSMKIYFKINVEPYRGRLRLVEVPYTKIDRGPLMGLPSNSKLYFSARSAKRSRSFSAWS